MSNEMAEIRSMLSEQTRMLGRVEGTLTEMQRSLDSGKSDSDDMERRLRKVENRQHWYAGATATIGVILGFIFNGGHR